MEETVNGNNNDDDQGNSNRFAKLLLKKRGSMKKSVCLTNYLFRDFQEKGKNCVTYLFFSINPIIILGLIESKFGFGVNKSYFTTSIYFPFLTLNLV